MFVGSVGCIDILEVETGMLFISPLKGEEILSISFISQDILCF